MALLIYQFLMDWEEDSTHRHSLSECRDEQYFQGNFMEQQRVLRMTEVKKITGLGRSSIYQMMKCDRFPKSIKIGKRAIGWISAEIFSWLEGRVRSGTTVNNSGQKYSSCEKNYWLCAVTLNPFMKISGGPESNEKFAQNSKQIVEEICLWIKLLFHC